jgi:addiction module RelE/StbE family toxin
MKVVVSEHAQADLIAIREWFQERNPAAGRKIAAEVRRRLKLLQTQPHSGRLVEERPGVREIVVGNYVIPYKVDEASIVVLRVWHGRQDRAG